MLRDRYVKSLSTIHVLVAHTSVASIKPKVELDSNADTCVVDDNCLVIHNANRKFNVYSYDPEDDHRSAKTVDAAAGYQGPQSGRSLS